MKTSLLLAALLSVLTAASARAYDLNACLSEYTKWSAMSKEDSKTPEYRKKYEAFAAAVTAKGCPQWRDVQNCKSLKGQIDRLPSPSRYDPNPGLNLKGKYFEWKCDKWVAFSEPLQPGHTREDPACPELRRQLMAVTMGTFLPDAKKVDPIRAQLKAKHCP